VGRVEELDALMGGDDANGDFPIGGLVAWGIGMGM
jgi:hypothetical protein